MNLSELQVGDKVIILNKTLGGKLIREGVGEIKNIVERRDDLILADIEFEDARGTLYPRYIWQSQDELYGELEN